MRLFTPGQLASVRFLVAGLFFAGYALWRRPTLPRGRDALRVIAAGAAGIAAYNLLLNTGELSVSAGTASFLINCMPLFAALLGILFLNERLGPLGWAGIATSFGGVALIAFTVPGGVHGSFASLLILAAAACAALMGFLQKPLLRRFSPLIVTACMMWSGAVLLLPFLPGALRAIAQTPGSQVAWPLATTVYLGVFPAAVGYLMWAQVLRQMPLAQASSFLYLIPPVALVISYLWLGERVGFASIAGGALALLGVFLLTRYGKARSVPLAARAPRETL